MPYRAYLIRLWETQRGGVVGHHVTAENVATGECTHFSDLESLFDFLKTNGDAQPKTVAELSDIIRQEDP